MNHLRSIVLGTFLLMAAAAPGLAAMPVVVPAEPSARETLAAREVVRYVFVRTGELLPIVAGAAAPADGAAIILARKDRPVAGIDAATQAAVAALKPEEYLLKTLARPQGAVLLICGGDDTGTLYGAYRLAEHLGVRFYLHGDVIPDTRIPLALPELNETGKPLFATRGIQPFHDFAEGPDWWNQDDYLTYVGQLAKMRLNFLGLHCYPQGGVGPEPLVWIGLPQDVHADGTVGFSYPTAWHNTARSGMWGYAATKTSDFTNGAALLFPDDIYGPDVMQGLMPLPKTPQESNELFNRVGRQMGVVFAAARKLGVKTCIGTETPLTIPNAVCAHLKALGKDPADPKVVRELYAGMFQRIAAAMPVDYYWLWTPEGWTWGGNSAEQFEGTKRDILAAYDALKAAPKPVQLATCGWVLGPQHDRAALDAFLPKDCPMSCINRQVGHESVEYAFANVHGRPKWAIPWMENDPNLVAYQPWAARMRWDAVDARRLGCDGLLGIHWRTKILAANVAALAQASWDQSFVPAAMNVSAVAPFAAVAGPGGSVAKTAAAIAGAAPDEQKVYQSCRYNTNGYTLEVPNGTYDVTLKFCEITYAAPGKRVFGVVVQGQVLAEKLDLFATVGKDKAYDLTVKGVKVTDGKLKIEFSRVVEFPLINGIVLDGRTEASNQLVAAPLLRRINCGGDACPGYEADMAGGGSSGKNPAPHERAMPVGDFYEDMARASFGAAVAMDAGALMATLDGMGFEPNPTDWIGGPGSLNTNVALGTQATAKGAVVARFAALRPKVVGPGNLERFDYWCHTFQASVTMYEFAAIRGQLAAAVKKIEATKDAAAKKALAQDALKLRLDLVRVWDRLLQLEIGTVSTPGELGTIANLEQHSRVHAGNITGFDKVLTAALGADLPATAAPAMRYAGPPRIIMTTVRTQAAMGESVALKVIILPGTAAQDAVAGALFWRPLGGGEFQKVPLTHVARAVYGVTLPPLTGDAPAIEYYIDATAGAQTLHFPATAPVLNQTIVCTGGQS